MIFLQHLQYDCTVIEFLTLNTAANTIQDVQSFCRTPKQAQQITGRLCLFVEDNFDHSEVLPGKHQFQLGFADPVALHLTFIWKLLC